MLAKLHIAGNVLKPVAIDLCRCIDQKTFNDAIVSLSESDLLQGSNDDDDGGGIAEVSEISSTTSSSITSLSSSSSSLSRSGSREGGLNIEVIPECAPQKL